MPDKDLPLELKRGLGKAANLRNRHEQDAYAAAIKAYYRYANKLKQAARMLSGLNPAERDLIIAKVIMKHSVSEAINNKEAYRR